MKILITGCSGFIGYHLANKLCKYKNIKILGLDNYDKYYSIKLKKLRIRILKKRKNFSFIKINITNIQKLDLIFKKFMPDVVYHLAGQPGVLYSYKDPLSYTLNNVLATKNICKISKFYKVKKFIFSSSSSVYGDKKKFPILENFKTNPKNYYAQTKLKCEKIVKNFFKNSVTHFVIFRFFTVYGPLGRPDMFIHKYLNSLKDNKDIFLHNYGKNFRDFTFVEDVVKILINCLKFIPNTLILNICRSKPIKTLKLVSLINKIYKSKKKNIILKGRAKGEMLKTHGDNQKLRKIFKNISFTDIKVGLKKTINVFKKYNY